MNHKLHECKDIDCPICVGGLAMCDICGGAEASLPIDCPGVVLTSDQHDKIQAGTLNYVSSMGWVVPNSEKASVTLGELVQVESNCDVFALMIPGFASEEAKSRIADQWEKAMGKKKLLIIEAGAKLIEVKNGGG